MEKVEKVKCEHEEVKKKVVEEENKTAISIFEHDENIEPLGEASGEAD